MNTEDEVFKNFLVEMGEKLEELENGLAELEEGFFCHGAKLPTLI